MPCHAVLPCATQACPPRLAHPPITRPSPPPLTRICCCCRPWPLPCTSLPLFRSGRVHRQRDDPPGLRDSGGLSPALSLTPGMEPRGRLRRHPLRRLPHRLPGGRLCAAVLLRPHRWAVLPGNEPGWAGMVSGDVQSAGRQRAQVAHSKAGSWLGMWGWLASRHPDLWPSAWSHAALLTACWQPVCLLTCRTASLCASLCATARLQLLAPSLPALSPSSRDSPRSAGCGWTGAVHQDCQREPAAAVWGRDRVSDRLVHECAEGQGGGVFCGA